MPRVIWKSLIFSYKYSHIHDNRYNIIEKISQTWKSCVYLHQTDFPSRIPRSQKTRNSKGFCEDNLPPQMTEQNLSGRGGTGHSLNSKLRPSQAVIQFIYITNSNTDCGSCARPGSQKHWHTIPTKRGCCPKGCILLSITWIYICPSPARSWRAVPAHHAFWQKEIHCTLEDYFCCDHPAIPAAQTAWT